MSAVAEIEAAIEKLSAIKRHCGLVVAGEDAETVYFRTDDDIDDDGNSFSFGDGIELGAEEYVEGIVTLHRTIDAQLAILHIGLHAYTEYISDIRRALDHDRAALALARAINGTA